MNSSQRRLQSLSRGKRVAVYVAIFVIAAMLTALLDSPVQHLINWLDQF